MGFNWDIIKQSRGPRNEADLVVAILHRDGVNFLSPAFPCTANHCSSACASSSCLHKACIGITCLLVRIAGRAPRGVGIVYKAE